MIDTIAFRIPLPIGGVEAVTKHSRIRHIVSGSTGETISEIVLGNLKGSWDYRVCLAIKEKEYVWIPNTDKPKGGSVEILACDPWLRVEFSLHKWAWGLNCSSWTITNALDALDLFCPWLSAQLEIELPPLDTWKVLRLDLGFVARFIDEQTMQQYLDHLRRIEYPRRRLRAIQYQTSVMWVGAQSILKLYGKQSEYSRHDKKRISAIIGKENSEFVSEELNGSLRIEAGWHGRALKTRGIFTVADLWECDLMEILQIDLKRIGLNERGEVRIWGSKEVRFAIADYILSAKNPSITTSAAYSVWTDAVLYGRKYCRETYGKNMTNRAYRLFRNADITVAGKITENEKILAPADLNPSRMETIERLLKQCPDLPALKIAA